MTRDSLTQMQGMDGSQVEGFVLTIEELEIMVAIKGFERTNHIYVYICMYILDMLMKSDIKMLQLFLKNSIENPQEYLIAETIEAPLISSSSHALPAKRLNQHYRKSQLRSRRIQFKLIIFGIKLEKENKKQSGFSICY